MTDGTSKGAREEREWIDGKKSGMKNGEWTTFAEYAGVTIRL